MLMLSINNETRSFAEPIVLQELLHEWQNQNPDAAFAVAINGEFVPRSQYQFQLLQNGDSIDIVSPVGGG
jgi:sulfur carrier protein